MKLILLTMIFGRVHMKLLPVVVTPTLSSLFSSLRSCISVCVVTPGAFFSSSFSFCTLSTTFFISPIVLSSSGTDLPLLPPDCNEFSEIGMIINFYLNNNNDNVCKLCARNSGVLNKVKRFLPEQALYKLYCSLILPYLNYGLLLWGNANKTYLNKVYKLQKRALRTISNSSYLSPSKPLFERYNALNIFDMYDKEAGIFMYKYNNNMLPHSFDGLFTEHQSNHSYNTRNKGDYQFHMFRMRTILNTGPKIWNSLPKNVKCSKSISQFKRNFVSFYNSWSIRKLNILIYKIL